VDFALNTPAQEQQSKSFKDNNGNIKVCYVYNKMINKIIMLRNLEQVWQCNEKRKLIRVIKWSRAQSHQQKFSDLRNFMKMSENFKPTAFVRKVRKLFSQCFGLDLKSRNVI
jgi:hypothetical protein